MYYHIIWGTKYKAPIIDPAIEKLLLQFIPKKVRQCNGQPLELNMTEDHVHLLLTIPPTISISEFVNRIKGSSSHFININLAKKAFYWQAGYGAVSLSAKGLPFIRAYIRNQKLRHVRNDLQDILEYASE